MSSYATLLNLRHNPIRKVGIIISLLQIKKYEALKMEIYYMCIHLQFLKGLYIYSLF